MAGRKTLQKGARTSRARERELLEQRAAAVTMPRSADVCVIGGGAAGLTFAAGSAQLGARTLLIEREGRWAATACIMAACPPRP